MYAVRQSWFDGSDKITAFEGGSGTKGNQRNGIIIGDTVKVNAEEGI